MSFFKSIRFKLLLMTIGLQLLVAIIFVVVALVSSNKLLDDNSIAVSESIEDTIQTAIEDWRVSTLAYARIAAHDPTPAMAAAIKSADTDVIVELARDVFSYTQCSGMTFTDTEGNALARVHNPGNSGDNIRSSLAIADALEGRSVSYVYPTLNSGFSITAGVPILEGNTQIGVLFLSKRLDTTGTIAELKRMTGCEVVIFQGNTPVLASFSDNKESPGELSDKLQSSLNAGISVVELASFQGNSAVWRYTPIEGRNGAVVGTILTIHANENQSWVIIMWICLVLGIAVILTPIILRMVNKIARPLVILTAFMKRASSTGDLSLSPEDVVNIGKLAKAEDEIGQTIASSAAFVGHVTNIAKELETIAGGDLSADVVMLSDADTMGKSLKEMVEHFNSMFAEIQEATAQVSSGSKQVADGAQSLAQGSTEQAASIEQLSSSISEIAERTKTNAQTADKTSRLSETIRDNAEKGSRQMDEMITAVGEINEASKSISKIIKTIDDIAFQTNILALNAAVEAARAGQHGKGFAVVAEEVRNLASKSAEAAKDTGNMIQNSMEKAELGARIAGETAASLSGIVSGINESSQLIKEIASASEQQSLGISQINIGIDQVAQVIQHNSATAEQSAAASQEMSKQSGMLQQLIKQFRLKDSGAQYRSLPSSGKPKQKRYTAPENTGYENADNIRDFGKY